jgi:hypothetical protein
VENTNERLDVDARGKELWNKVGYEGRYIRVP